ncbi:RNA-binding protein 43 [Larimichthys crocea]|uniref:RNA-binding protein 43 n=1 Tax=Larimichthys crocea TaxID=215358 RepID=UPI0009010E22|nr:RNA-binding protein 43 [Larimichthys crocea]
METCKKGRRTVVVSGVPDVLPVSRMIDKLTIHFQSRRRSHGGDVEVVTYPTNMDGVAFVSFDEAADAENVVRKDQHKMADDEFPEEYVLTVFPFTRDVFFFVTNALVDLSEFGRDQESLIQSLRSAHRSLHFQPVLKRRRVVIQGPFSAVQALRGDLKRRSSQLKSSVSAPTAAIKLRETPFNPEVISHHEVVSSVSRSRSKAKLEPASSNSLSTPLQTTGEATQVQASLSNAKTQITSPIQKVSCGSMAVGSFCDTDNADEEQGARSRLQMPTEYRTEWAKANPRLVLGEEINAGIKSSLSGLDLGAEKITEKQPRKDNTSQKNTRPDRSATKDRGEIHLDFHYRESDQSSSAVTAKLLQTALKDVLQSSESITKDTGELSAVCPDLENSSIWVDSYTFEYIKKYDKTYLDMCLRGLDASVERAEGTDLTRISLTEKQAPKTGSRIQQTLIKLSTLVEWWMSRLRVNQIDYDEREYPDKQKLSQICDDENSVSRDVLYVFEDACIKVIGPSFSSHMFSKSVEDRIGKDKSLRK